VNRYIPVAGRTSASVRSVCAKNCLIGLLRNNLLRSGRLDLAEANQLQCIIWPEPPSELENRCLITAPRWLIMVESKLARTACVTTRCRRARYLASWGDLARARLVDRYTPPLSVYNLYYRYRLSNHEHRGAWDRFWLLLWSSSHSSASPPHWPGWLARPPEAARMPARLEPSGAKPSGWGQPWTLGAFSCDDAVIDEEIRVAERKRGLRAPSRLRPPRCHQLLSMLLSDPRIPTPYPPRARQIPRQHRAAVELAPERMSPSAALSRGPRRVR